jgi:3-dehydroquinate synthase class II
MLRCYFVSNDWREDVAQDLLKEGYKVHSIGSDGIVIQYTDVKKLSHIFSIIQGHDKSYQDLGDITMDEVEESKYTPFNHIDVEKFMEYFGINSGENK